MNLNTEVRRVEGERDVLGDLAKPSDVSDEPSDVSLAVPEDDSTCSEDSCHLLKKYEENATILQPCLVEILAVKSMLTELGFLECFSRLDAISNRDPRAAVAIAINEIHESGKISHWTRFILALQHNGYGNIAKLLQGPYPSGGDYQAFFIKALSPFLRLLVHPLQLIDYLQGVGILDANAIRAITTREEMNGRVDAADLLLQHLPNSHTYWYNHFVQALSNTGNHVEAFAMLNIPAIRNEDDHHSSLKQFCARNKVARKKCPSKNVSKDSVCVNLDLDVDHGKHEHYYSYVRTDELKMLVDCKEDLNAQTIDSRSCNIDGECENHMEGQDLGSMRVNVEEKSDDLGSGDKRSDAAIMVNDSLAEETTRKEIDSVCGFDSGLNSTSETYLKALCDYNESSQNTSFDTDAKTRLDLRHLRPQTMEEGKLIDKPNAVARGVQVAISVTSKDSATHVTEGPEVQPLGISARKANIVCQKVSPLPTKKPAISLGESNGTETSLPAHQDTLTAGFISEKPSHLSTTDGLGIDDVIGGHLTLDAYIETLERQTVALELEAPKRKQILKTLEKQTELLSGKQQDIQAIRIKELEVRALHHVIVSGKNFADEDDPTKGVYSASQMNKYNTERGTPETSSYALVLDPMKREHTRGADNGDNKSTRSCEHDLLCSAMSSLAETNHNICIVKPTIESNK